jgi:glyoxylase-like metal-dependent hydrolase (beta-lactamase superfamily II)
MKQALLFSLFLLTARAIDAQPHYRVYAVRFASILKPLPLSYWVQKAGQKDSVNIDFMVWLIKGDNGKTVLLDAGFQRGLDEQKEFEPFDFTRPDSALEKLGVKATDITDIILSHPHWDHIDGLNLFPNAHAWIQKEDYGYYVGGAWQIRAPAKDSAEEKRGEAASTKDWGQPGGFAKRDVRMLLEYNIAGRLTLVDGDDKEIIPGITVYTGSRHTFNSQFVVVNTGSNKVLLASDNIWVYYSLDHMMTPSEGGTFDNAAFVRSLQRMKTLVPDPKYIIPGHDGQIFTRFPKVADNAVEIR